MNKRILIIGDAGRGKSTFAENLSRKTGIPFYSTDDFYWNVKFTEPNDKEKSIADIKKVYDSDTWIMDGSTRHLVQGGLERADVIYLLQFEYLLPQYYFLIARHFKRSNERLIDVWELLKHVTYKKYKKGYGSHLPPLEELLKPYETKVIKLTTLKAIHKQLEDFKVQ